MSWKPPRDLGPVVQAPLDRKTYKAVQLENGLRAVLVSTCEDDDVASRSTPRDAVTSFNKRVLGINSYSVIDDGNSPSQDDGGGWATMFGKRLPFNGGASPEDSTGSSPPPKKRKRGSCGVGRATICVCVGAGSFHDPQDIYGMAHLTEHVIFLGSKGFPQPNLLFHKVFENGGVVNAVTFAEHTRFYFSCNCSSFEDCVEILADALHQPLLDSRSVLREVEAVDSEYGIKQTCDGTRMYDFLRSLATDRHPLRKFYWGNKESLSHPRLVERLRSWHDRYYRGSNMTVCMQGPFPLQQLEEILVRQFSPLPPADPQCHSPTKELLLQGHPFEPPSRFCAMYHIAPVAHMSQLLVTWALPPSAWKNYEGKPLQYIRWMLTSTHPGGLRRFLIEKGWIDKLFASCSKSDNIFRNSFCALFCIQLELTDKGVLERDLVIEALFSYLKLVCSEGVKQSYFEEMKRTSATAFHFFDWTEMLDTGIEIAANLRWAAPKDVLTCNRLMSTFEQEKIQVCLEMMCPRAANFILVAKEGVQSCTKQACWGCPICHTKIVIGEEFYETLDNISVYSCFRLPGKGDFLAKEISFEKQQFVPPGKVVLETEKLLVRHIQQPSADLSLWSRNVPKGHFAVYLYSPVIGQRPFKQGLLMVWLRIVVRDVLLQTGIKFWKLFQFDLDVHDECVSVWVNGPSCHLGELLETILGKMVKSGAELSCEEKGTFDNMKVELEREYTNNILGVKDLADDLHAFLLLSDHRSLFELKADLEESDFDDFTRLLHNFRRTLSFEVEMKGCVVKSDCERITGFLSSLECTTTGFNVSPFPIFAPRATLLPQCQSVLHVQGLHPSYVVSVLTNHYQFGEISMEKLRFADILCRLMRRRMAGQLRTKEQLGYTVQMFVVRDCGSVGLTVVVFTQPQKFTTAYVDSRVETFFRSFCKAFFQDEPLARKMLACVTKEEVDLRGLRCFYESYLLPRGSCFRKLSIQVTGFRPPRENPCRKGGPTGKEASDDAGKCTFLEYLTPKKEGQYKNAIPISNIMQFKRGLALLPPEQQ